VATEIQKNITNSFDASALLPSVSVAAQTIDLKTFSPLLGVAGARVFPAGREAPESK
jgi:hypothetical protein